MVSTGNTAGFSRYPNFDPATFLCHCDTAPLVDDLGHAVSTYLNILNLSDTYAKFGAKALYFDGTYYVVSAATPDYDAYGHDFTVDFWFLTDIGTWSATPLFNMNYLNISVVDPYTMRVATQNNGGQDLDVSFALGGGIPLSSQVWYHLAFVYNHATTTWALYLNGTSLGSGSESTFNSNQLLFGYTSTFANNLYLDELRFTNNQAVWASNFTPPASPYQASGTTGVAAHMLSYGDKL